MKARIVLIGLVLATALGAWGEIKVALESVRAPGGEYIRMPAKFVLQKIESSARNSGDPELGAFRVEVRVPELEDRRVNINMESKNLLEVLEAIASATKSTLVFEGTSAVLVDPSAAVELEPEPEIVRAPEPDTDDEVDFSDVGQALVFVSSGRGLGSGFVAEMDGKTYVFSNQHNFLGATKLELRAMHGGLLEYESFEFNRARDLVRFQLSGDALDDLGTLRFAAISPTIGQEVVVYGNSAGGNVATELRGEVLGVGPRDVEIDAKIVPGNSGSPILNSEGEVIGVATYLTLDLKLDKNDPRAAAFKKSRFKKERRYGVRVPKGGWVQVDVREFLRQSYALADAKSFLWVTYVLVQYWNGDEEYEAAALRVMDSFSSLDKKTSPPVKFHTSEMEEEARMMTRAFKRNFEEFADLAQDDKALAKLKDDKSTPKIARVDYHIRTSMLGRVKRARDNLAKWTWMSETLKAEAKPMEETILSLTRILESEKGIRERAKAAQ